MKTFHFYWGIGVMVSTMVLLGCDVETQSLVNPTEFVFEYDFEEDEQGWAGVFANFPVGEENLYELAFSHDTLPENLLPPQGALRMSGNNRNDDLLMFLKKQVSGLKPNTSYALVFNIDFASQYPENAVRPGGAPGDSVALLVGAVQLEPKVTKVKLNDTIQFNEPNFNFPISSQPGEKTADVLNIGNISIAGDEFIYTFISRSNEEMPFDAVSDKDGKLWVMVGTDSGFEGTTTLFYDKIRVTFREK